MAVLRREQERAEEALSLEALERHSRATLQCVADSRPSTLQNLCKSHAGPAAQAQSVSLLPQQPLQRIVAGLFQAWLLRLRLH